MLKIIRLISKIYLFVSAIRKLNLQLIKKHSELLKQERGSRTTSETSLVVRLSDHCAYFDPRKTIRNLLLGF
ncbi:hypothetical protein PTTG_26590 [Puccinia triticina 1-1 BBBD Race 1]|uniref:Uncharacterized protein n=2 Tax=Puccinia triticina TaxID=208348 RepID=A0A180GUA9_PUCT1|nr:uncharacterized protein PtA15_7A655 [Puccinia triticina]OAV95553.1 hypothetical protein PTTG_26590 [Puccinia triticina 1-1 BBBD Race 1]WAQ86926.1 hypothetical protein PtA15_7A655 [Puccinia triticina]WAR56793.1 hypothetical protein PtB15_7B643 [Puccinia triticina]